MFSKKLDPAHKQKFLCFFKSKDDKPYQSLVKDLYSLVLIEQKLEPSELPEVYLFEHSSKDEVQLYIGFSSKNKEDPNIEKIDCYVLGFMSALNEFGSH